MQILHSVPGNTSRQEVAVSTIGLLVVMVIGVCASIALVLFLLWGTCQLLLLAVQSSIEALSVIGTLYATSDPFIKFCLLVSIGYIIYRLYLHTRKVKS